MTAAALMTASLLATTAFHNGVVASSRLASPCHRAATKMWDNVEWTPLADAARHVCKMTGSQAEAVREFLGSKRSDLIRHAWHSGIEMANGWQRHLESALITSSVEGRVELPSSAEATIDRRSQPHTFEADKGVTRRVAGPHANGRVSKLEVMQPDGSVYAACVPRGASRDLIVVAKNKQSTGVHQEKRLGSSAWILQGSDPSHVYIHDRMDVDADVVLDKLDNGSHIHCCVSKDMEKVVLAVLNNEAELRGEDLSSKLRGWQEEGRWHTECMCKSAKSVDPAEHH